MIAETFKFLYSRLFDSLEKAKTFNLRYLGTGSDDHRSINIFEILLKQLTIP